MDDQTYSVADSGVTAERAPLTRLRASRRPPPKMMPEPLSASLLPSAATWSALFGDGAVSAGECTALNAIARARRVSPGAMVFTRSDVAAGMMFIGEGDVVLGGQGPDGAFRTERHLHGPAWLDVSAGWLQQPHTLDARAMTMATVVELPREALQTTLERQPSLARRIIATLAREVRTQVTSAQDLMHKDAPARLAAWLLQRCLRDAHRPGRAIVQLPMRKRDIASQLAITPETLSRLMRGFTSQGLIQVAGYTVHVLDLVGLGRVAEVA